jgi:hypothetical protein
LTRQLAAQRVTGQADIGNALHGGLLLGILAAAAHKVLALQGNKVTP